MAIAHFPAVVLDCPDPKTLAEFYGALLDWKIEPGDDGWSSVRAGYGDSINFQKVESFTPPQWPGRPSLLPLPQFAQERPLQRVEADPPGC